MSTKKSITEALADSSAHGVGRVVSSRSLPLRIMWAILFLVFLALCCKSSSSLINKLINISVVSKSESNKVPFEFPDLYFCPTLVYSGSIPYTLSESEAEMINSETERLSKLYDQLYCRNNYKMCNTGETATFKRLAIIQLSMPVHLQYKYLLQRHSQSFLLRPFVQHYSLSVAKNYTGIEAFIHPNNRVCYKITMSAEDRESLNYQRSMLFAWPFVDPHYSDFHFNGVKVNPIVNPWLNESIPIENWDTAATGFHSISRLGFTLLVVQRDTYPSLLYGTQIDLAAGRSHNVELTMEDNVYNPELYEDYCNPYQEDAVFVNQLTDKPIKFVNNEAACFYTEMSNLLNNSFGFLSSNYPKPWTLRHVPRLENMTEVAHGNAEKSHSFFKAMIDFIDENTPRVVKSCKKDQPCDFKMYTAISSSSKWPRVNKALLTFLENEFGHHRIARRSRGMPATEKLANLSRELLLGNPSSHSVSLFRHYISDSMLEVKISVKTHMSTRVLIEYSYSWVAFLADIGGILGLYIGCSMLTLCELLEFFYHLVGNAVKSIQASRKEKDAAAADKTNDEDRSLRHEDDDPTDTWKADEISSV